MIAIPARSDQSHFGELLYHIVKIVQIKMNKINSMTDEEPGSAAHDVLYNAQLRFDALEVDWCRAQHVLANERQIAGILV